MSQVPGWHATIFPPYFVAGAIFAGFAMVLILCIPLRAWYNLKDFITDTHLVYMGKVMLATGMIVVYGYAMEAFFGWYSAGEYERYMMYNRIWGGPYWWSYWLLILCNGVSIQFLWFKRFRESAFWLFIISLVVSVGMWLERFVIIITSLTPRLSAVFVGDVFTNDLGLVNVYRHNGIIYNLDFPICQISTGYLDFRGQNAFAGCECSRASRRF